MFKTKEKNLKKDDQLIDIERNGLTEHDKMIGKNEGKENIKTDVGGQSIKFFVIME